MSTTGKIVKGGALVVNFYADGVTKHAERRSVVAETFLGPRPAGAMVVHRDGDADNYRVANVRYAPHRFVSLVRWTNGTAISMATALEIRRRAPAGE